MGGAAVGVMVGSSVGSSVSVGDAAGMGVLVEAGGCAVGVSGWVDLAVRVGFAEQAESIRIETSNRKIDFFIKHPLQKNSCNHKFLIYFFAHIDTVMETVAETP